MNTVSDAIILTHRDKNGDVLAPHIHHLAESNPQVTIHIVVGEDIKGKSKRYHWKNADISLRNWWKENRDKTQGEVFFIGEWDTLITCSLPEMPKEFDLVGKKFIKEPEGGPGRPLRMRNPKWTDANWMWWRDLDQVKRKHHIPLGYGLISLGAFFARREVLNILASSKWDFMYEEDVLSELRIPSIAKWSGLRVGETHLPDVEFDNVIPRSEKSIYHGVPYPYEM